MLFYVMFRCENQLHVNIRLITKFITLISKYAIMIFIFSLYNLYNLFLFQDINI